LKYLPPEALKKLANAVGPWWDIWAMGVILFVLVSGRLPFNGSTEAEIMRAIAYERA